MKTTRARRVRRAALFAVSAVSVAATVLVAGAGRAVASPASAGANPIVRIDGGLIRGASAAGAYSFLRAAVRRPADGEPAVAATAARAGLVGSPGRDAVRTGLPAGTDGQPVPPARDDQRRLPEPERLHPDAAQWQWPARAGVDPRRRSRPGRRPQLRRHQARGGRHGRRHDQLPPRRARLPRAPGARLPARRPSRKLRLDGPAGGPALGPAQHRAVRRRPAQRDHRGPVGRRPVGARPAGLARRPRALPAGHRAERHVRAEPAAAGHGRGGRRDVRHGRRLRRTRPRRACATCRSATWSATSASRFPASSTARCSPSRSERPWPAGSSPGCRSSTASPTTRNCSSSPASASP